MNLIKRCRYSSGQLLLMLTSLNFSMIGMKREYSIALWWAILAIKYSPRHE